MLRSKSDVRSGRGLGLLETISKTQLVRPRRFGVPNRKRAGHDDARSRLRWTTMRTVAFLRDRPVAVLVLCGQTADHSFRSPRKATADFGRPFAPSLARCASSRAPRTTLSSVQSALLGPAPS
jgi:hypothetical protein